VPPGGCWPDITAHGLGATSGKDEGATDSTPTEGWMRTSVREQP
jgi:hypothetical protein